MTRSTWGIFGSAGLLLAGALAGCASNNDATGGAGGAQTTSSVTTSGTTSATTSATTSTTTSATTSTTTSTTTSATSSTTTTTTSTTTASTTASTGTGMIPANWTCDPNYYATNDGCDCGCGVIDPDCAGTTISDCGGCASDGDIGYPGSCSSTNCDAIDPSDISKCLPSAPENTDAACTNMIDDDFDGVVDCDDPSCQGHAMCPPVAWTCDPALYADMFCSCGCGVLDPGCMTTGIADCTTCDDTGSCEDRQFVSTCPGVINTTNNAVCAVGTENTDALCSNGLDDDGDGNTDCDDVGCLGHSTCPPVGWTCQPSYYSDSTCDCGCGVHDPICSDNLVTSCAYCTDAGSCADPHHRCYSINATNNAVCN